MVDRTAALSELLFDAGFFAVQKVHGEIVVSLNLRINSGQPRI